MAMKTRAGEAASFLGKLRWKGKTPEEKSAFMKSVRAKRSNAPGGRSSPGRPRSTDRCYCGECTWTRALARAFGCCKKKGLFPTGKKEPPELLHAYKAFWKGGSLELLAPTREKAREQAAESMSIPQDRITVKKALRGA